MNSRTIPLLFFLFITGNINAEPLSFFNEKGFRTGPEALIPSGILILLGLVFILTGKRLIKFLSFISGFLFFGVFTILISSRYFDFINGRQDHRDIILGVSLAISLVGGILCYCFLKLGVMFLSFLMGYSIGGIILQGFQNASFWAQVGVMIGFGSVLAILSIFFIDRMILVGTSYIGSQTFLIGIDVIVNRGYIDFIKANTNLQHIQITEYSGGLLSCSILLTIIGALFQYKIFKKSNYYEIEKQQSIH